MTKTSVSAALFTLLAVSGTAAAQPAPQPSPASAPQTPPAPGAYPPGPGYPPPGYPPPPGYAPAPGAPLAPSPLYAPAPGAPAYGAAMQAVPSPPEGTAAYVGSAMVGATWDFGIPIGSVH